LGRKLRRKLQKNINRYICMYDVLILNGKERLIKFISSDSESVLYYISNDALFDILHDSHIDHSQ
jgi:hypothetical protein